eukprot:15243-Heterococcus_DN1.PRE.2
MRAPLVEGVHQQETGHIQRVKRRTKQQAKSANSSCVLLVITCRVYYFRSTCAAATCPVTLETMVQQQHHESARDPVA